MSTPVSDGKPLSTATLGHGQPRVDVPRPNGVPASPKPGPLPAPVASTGWGFRLHMLMPVLLCGLGTTGTQIVVEVIQWVLRELHRIPHACNYLCIDGRESVLDLRHFLGLDVDGCGTDPHAGRELFLEHRDRIWHMVRQQMESLAQFDPQVPVERSPREATAVWIFAGCGGSSGGMLHPMIGLVHDAAQHCRIPCRVYLVLVGADIVLRDSTRATILEQRLVVPGTCANNLIKVFTDITSSALLREERPDGTKFDLPAARRVWSPLLFDQSNGKHEWTCTDDLVAMAAEVCALQLFTPMGKFLEDRNKDHEKLGLSARGSL